MLQQPKMKPPSPEQLVYMFKSSGLLNKLLFTFAMIGIFRLGVHLPLYGIDNNIFSALAHQNNLINFVDLFSGGALSKISILALGIGPYITSSIIMQLLAVVIPSLEKLQKEEGEAGRRKLSQYTRMFTVAIAVLQSVMFMTFLIKTPNMLMAGINPVFYIITSTIILTAGAVFVMWLAEIITERGVGNGGSLLIFVGILSRIPYYTKQIIEMFTTDHSLGPKLVVLLSIFFLTMVFIVIMQEAIRKVIIVNPKRQVGNKIYGGMSTYIPFKLNPGGVMPIIFAIAILYFPATVLGILQQMNIFQGQAVQTVINRVATILNPSGITHYVLYFSLIVLLTFFYASIMPNMQPKEIANNLKKYGSSIPGVKPGKPTAEVLDAILSKTTFIGAIGLGIIALIPSLATYVTGITVLQGIGATSLIIMVGVALDFINQIKTQLMAKNYESFLKE